MDITITIRGLEELGLGLSALAAALPETARQLATLPEAARQLAALARHNGPCANNVSTAALQPPAQLPQTPDRPTPAQYVAPKAAETMPTTAAASTTVPTVATITPSSTAPATVAVPTAAPSYTLEDIRLGSAQLRDMGKLADVRALMERFGIKTLTAIQPEQIGEYALCLRQLGANI